jgi:hypothetical protein
MVPAMASAIAPASTSQSLSLWELRYIPSGSVCTPDCSRVLLGFRSREVRNEVVSYENTPADFIELPSFIRSNRTASIFSALHALSQHRNGEPWFWNGFALHAHEDFDGCFVVPVTIIIN